MRLLTVAPLLLLLAIPPSWAQGDPILATLDLDVPTVGGEGRIAVAPESAPLMVPWTYKFANPATASAALAGGNTSIAWTLACASGNITLLGSPTTIPVEAGKTDYTGTALLQVSASADTQGMMGLNCTISGSVPNVGAAATTASEPFNPEVAFVGSIRLGVPVKMRTAGPQKIIPYEIEVENLGNSLTSVSFEFASDFNGKWNGILPESLLIEPGATETAVLAIATPYKTGPNKGSMEIVLVATPHAATDEDQVGPAVDAQLLAKVRGWYIPGPSPILLLAGLAVAALAARRAR
ncbi:MAG: hypothetical protein WC876_12185 [Candidatus Thermoplasmatota archaeon]|jgi:hypothetical protein